MAVDDLRFDDVEFPLAWCEPCGREVLLAAVNDGPGRSCVHCGATPPGQPREVRGADLSEHGYALHEAKGCARSGCGGGGCRPRS